MWLHQLCLLYWCKDPPDRQECSLEGARVIVATHIHLPELFQHLPHVKSHSGLLNLSGDDQPDPLDPGMQRQLHPRLCDTGSVLAWEEEDEEDGEGVKRWIVCMYIYHICHLSDRKHVAIMILRMFLPPSILTYIFEFVKKIKYRYMKNEFGWGSSISVSLFSTSP